MRAINLRTEHMINPIGIDFKTPFLSWQCVDGVSQTAYELEALTGEDVIWKSGKIESNQMNTRLNEPLSSRQIVTWRVRLWDEKEEVGEWSQEGNFEMGLLEKNHFVAKWINPELSCDPQVHKPANHLKTSFEVKAYETARLYVTSHGLYEAWINGQRVGDFVLAPGTSNYDKHFPYQTYDVTDLLVEGLNQVEVILGDGWYRSCSGVDGDRNLYGEDVALFFQLEADGEVVCISDENWLASQEGPIRENDMHQGEVIDGRIESIENWHGVKVEAFGVNNLAPSNTVPIVEAEHFEGRIFTTPNGEKVIDYGQNLAGYIEFTLEAAEGQTIVLTHGETLDEDGNFTTENFQDRERHKEGGTKQAVAYTCREGLNTYKTKFSIWGFRYAKVETDIDLAGAKFTAIAVYSQMESLGHFECANQDVNQLVSNSRWSLKSNFCDVPTDCPTRERAAWTGDMGVFVDTGIFIEDCYPVIRKWLGECRLSQYPDGKVANIAPKNNHPTQFSEMLSGSVGWGDASIIVPWAMYQRTGDLGILEENYEMMKGWYSFLEARASQNNDENIVGKDNPYAAYTIDTGVDYGEWCEPDVNSMAAMARPQFKTTTAYYALSGRFLAKIAECLGHEEDAKHYADLGEEAAKAYHHVATNEGKIESDRQADYVRALDFGLLTEAESKEAAKDLNQMVVDHGYHLNTGFLSTPSLCKVLADYGYVETAYRLLLQDTMPSWLYAVKKGATTIWENWDGVNEQGQVKASLNHYSYGAVTGWLFGGVCGIQVTGTEVVIKPQPCKLMQHAKATYHSPLGTIVSGWHYEGDQVVYELEIPSNVVAKIVLGDGREMVLKTGSHTIKG